MKLDISHVEMRVENIIQSEFFYTKAFGFSNVQMKNLCFRPMGIEHRFLKQQDIKLILTSSLNPESTFSEEIAKHGDYLKDVALFVDDVELATQNALKQGARVINPVREIQNDHGVYRCSQIGVFGSVVHTLIEAETRGVFHLEGYCEDCARRSAPQDLSKSHFSKIDHIAVCVPADRLQELSDFYIHAFGFHESHCEEVNTGKSGMRSRVVESSCRNVKFVFTSPLEAGYKSQIEEYMNYNQGPGIQHMALQTTNIVSAMQALRESGVGLLTIPEHYYRLKSEAHPEMIEKLKMIQAHQVLLDQDENGYLFQAFTKPLQTRPTFFLEMIQRDGCHGFGSDNIHFLFKAIEEEQVKRGSL